MDQRFLHSATVQETGRATRDMEKDSKETAKETKVAARATKEITMEAKAQEKDKKETEKDNMEFNEIVTGAEATTNLGNAQRKTRHVKDAEVKDTSRQCANQKVRAKETERIHHRHQRRNLVIAVAAQNIGPGIAQSVGNLQVVHSRCR